MGRARGWSMVHISPMRGAGDARQVQEQQGGDRGVSTRVMMQEHAQPVAFRERVQLVVRSGRVKLSCELHCVDVLELGRLDSHRSARLHDHGTFHARVVRDERESATATRCREPVDPCEHGRPFGSAGDVRGSEPMDTLRPPVELVMPCRRGDRAHMRTTNPPVKHTGNADLDWAGTAGVRELEIDRDE